MSLRALLRRLPPDRAEVIVVDDRPAHDPPLRTPDWVRVVPGPARGPAAARNAGWRATEADWIVFLDEDVLPGPGWWEELQADLAQPESVAGVQARIVVPQTSPNERSDWAVSTAHLSDAAWITADMAYRRSALEEVGGFDEGFPGGCREDTDLACRVRQSAGELVLGRRRTVHPARREGRWIGPRARRGNGLAGETQPRRRYGPGWHRRLGAARGGRRIHPLTAAAALVTVAFGVGALFVFARRRNSPAGSLPEPAQGFP
ncbi:MAG TPA: glycosyltransferase [Candidatus Limnocylindrales bacterium]